MKHELRRELKLRREDGGQDKIINFRLSDKDFELAKQIREEEKRDFLNRLGDKRVRIPQEQQKLVLDANRAIERIILKYGLNLPDGFYKTVEVYPLYHEDYRRIMFDDEEDEEFIEADNDSEGMFIVESGAVIIRYERNKLRMEEYENLKFLYVVAHEIVHAKACKSFQAFREDVKIRPGGKVDPQVGAKRSGLNIVALGQTDRDFFNDLDEALTEELSRDVANEVISVSSRELFKPLILKQIEKRLYSPQNNNPIRDEALKRGAITEYASAGMTMTHLEPAANEFMEEIFRRGYEFEQGRHNQSYREGTEILSQIIAAIIRKNPNYKNEDEVKKFFYEAYFTGRTLNLGRMVEETFGKGTFRLMAENLFSEELQKRLKI